MKIFPSKSIPSDLLMKNLVALDMSYSKIESFGMSFSNPQPTEGKKMQLSRSCSKAERLLGSLKIHNLCFSEQLRSLGGFCEFPSLKSLFLKNCSGLIEACESIQKCYNIIHVDLS
ncbi:TMV resistance protein N-like protein isoform X1 [Tanacetum coccineum]|uniref:TMV resistance protein N-like protein isoform X1 n=1 Tax=Tanacetum coccineum TaxID=301880 RepID=A0ABQ4XPF6_9ASTR